MTMPEIPFCFILDGIPEKRISYTSLNNSPLCLEGLGNRRLSTASKLPGPNSRAICSSRLSSSTCSNNSSSILSIRCRLLTPRVAYQWNKGLPSWIAVSFNCKGSKFNFQWPQPSRQHQSQGLCSMPPRLPLPRCSNPPLLPPNPPFSNRFKGPNSSSSSGSKFSFSLCFSNNNSRSSFPFKFKFLQARYSSNSSSRVECNSSSLSGFRLPPLR